MLRQLIDQSLEKLKLHVEPTLEISSLDSLIYLISQGSGLTILPAPYLNFLNNSRITTIPFAPKIKRTIGFVYKKNRFMCSATKTFIDLVVNLNQSHYIQT